MGIIKNKLTLLLLLSLSIVLLLGCSYFVSSQEMNGKLVSESHKKLASLELSDQLTIHTVEFSSNQSVTNVGVAILDFNTKEVIEKDIVNHEGKIMFDLVFPDEAYEVVIYRITDNGEWIEQTRKSVVFNPENPVVQIETFNTSPQGSLHVPVVKQKPELPNGCEVTSLTALLNYYGIKIDKMELNKHLPKSKVYTKNGVRYGPDPNVSYAGDPTLKSGGYYVFASPLVETANNLLVKQQSPFRAMDISNASKEELIDYVKSGVPVLTWVTIDWKDARTSGYWIIEGTGQKHSVFTNLHAVVMTGYEDGKVAIMNPLNGHDKIDEKIFFKTYNQLGSHAMVIL